jgi:hypothetical protein
MAIAQPNEDKQREWAAQAQEKSLAKLDQLASELKGLREAVAKGEKLSLGRTNLLAKALEAAGTADGAW